MFGRCERIEYHDHYKGDGEPDYPSGWHRVGTWVPAFYLHPYEAPGALEGEHVIKVEGGPKLAVWARDIRSI